MKLKTFALSEGENELHYSSKKDGWLREVISHVRARDVPMGDELSADLNITKLDPEYFVRGELRFTLHQSCHRCAEAFDQPMRHRFGVAMAKLPQDVDIKSDDGDVTYFENEEMDLLPIVEEQIVLSLPYQALCRPDCAGIKLESRPDKTDGPFAILQKLKK